ncbi:MAG: 3-methylcrotonyl-CoA carboxylase [Proteobacteria bacterium]|nr:3-methylcrotonyl-CoA carboxylase [Pseudomonadota bacterium]
MTKTPYSTILVANRGEVALRIMRSARAAGYRCVAVHTDVDAGAGHVRAADAAVCIGAARAYLDIAAMVAAARASGADAVHPGYGFLAENADFAAACRAAGLVFIGPSPGAIRAMGNKAGAKRLMAAAGVPCVPGYDGDDQDAVHLAREAERIGWPVMIKAAAGGGGRGMRLCASAGEFAALLDSARSEAAHAFGDPTVILEKAIVAPRHVEVQVLADRYGHAIHLGERDCSVQRRHQKLIEEAPSPAVSSDLRERMGATALAAVRAIGYEGAGTLEFLLDGDGRPCFIEMNTRLQVEHPVTEAITGLDIVDLQLRIAAGEPLTLLQQDVSFDGHAIEVRLCAEDPACGFLPQSGTMALWRPSRALRVEHALTSGSAVSPYYDPMIAKLVAHGATREEARRRLLAGLADSVALGVTTNQAWLARCLRHPAFVDGTATTAFIARHEAELLLADDDDAASLADVLTAVLLFETAALQCSAARRLPHGLAMPLRYEIDGRACDATLTETSSCRHLVRIGDRSRAVTLVEVGDACARLVVDGVAIALAWVRDGGRLHWSSSGVPHAVLDLTLAPARRAHEAGQGDAVRASTTGRVVAVPVEPGQTIAAGAPVLVLEAMKMEHVHVAPRAGTVRAVHAAVGDQVAAGRVVIELGD